RGVLKFNSNDLHIPLLIVLKASSKQAAASNWYKDYVKSCRTLGFNLREETDIANNDFLVVKTGDINCSRFFRKRLGSLFAVFIVAIDFCDCSSSLRDGLELYLSRSSRNKDIGLNMTEASCRRKSHTVIPSGSCCHGLNCRGQAQEPMKISSELEGSCDL